MTRVKRGNVARKRRQKTLQLSSGFRGSSETLFRVANQDVLKALKHSSRDRVQRKRVFRSIWITRINAATRTAGLSYSQFVHLSKQSNVLLNRKIVSQLAILDKDAFHQLLSFVQ
uniref:ribosomal protein L20 n=1 Tax=Massjukichlorella minus TaxID=2650457 RepID=UPI0024115CE0|nr:ribosomal protein L20 [Massjukichlorella minus]WDY12994.1 ribosomal protein L20 [Massjukichlorella minus]